MKARSVRGCGAVVNVVLETRQCLMIVVLVVVVVAVVVLVVVVEVALETRQYLVIVGYVHK